MRSSIRFFVAASIAAAGLSLAGCNHYSIPQKDMPGGILSGNEYTRTRTTRGTPLENAPSDRIAGNTTGSGAPAIPGEARPRTPAGAGTTQPSASGASATVAPEPLVQPAPTTPPQVPPASATPNPAAPSGGPSNGASMNNVPAPTPNRTPPAGETGTTGTGAGTTAPPVHGGVTGQNQPGNGNNNQ